MTARILLGNALGFRDCSAETLEAFIDNGTVRTLRKGEFLARRGEMFSEMCLLVRGALETGMLRADGHRHLVGFLREGDVAGLIGLSDGLGHVHDLRSRESETTVLLIPATIITERRLIDRNLGRAFELQLAFRSRLLYERLSSDPSIPLEVRLARLLLALAGLYGVHDQQGWRLGVKISQVDLADWLGVSRQRINLAVQAFKNTGLMTLSYSTITIADKAGLHELAKND